MLMSVLHLALAASSSTVTPQRLMRWMIMRRGRLRPRLKERQQQVLQHTQGRPVFTQKLGDKFSTQ
jgi:hypothetical protein